MKPYRVRHVARLPRHWPKAPGLIADGDLRINRGRLRAKLVVFRDTKSLRAFWKRYVGFDLGRRCLGAVNGLGRMVETFGGTHDGRRVLLVDRRYFCIIGLVRDHLTMRVLSHESVHAGFAFAKRSSRNGWDIEAERHDEEAVAYPTGEIARAMVCFLERRGLIRTAA